MAFFPSTSKLLPLAFLLALAPACGDDSPAPENTDDDVTEDDEVDGTGSRSDGGRMDASRPANDASSVKPDAGDAGKPANDASTGTQDSGVDAGKTADAGKTEDAGKPDASKPDASTGGGTGVCDDKTPHGCFTPAADNQAGCPKQSPEIPFGYPSIDTWDLCNGGAVFAGGVCNWNGPTGGTATCVCDTGAHWLCVYL